MWKGVIDRRAEWSKGWTVFVRLYRLDGVCVYPVGELRSRAFVNIRVKTLAAGSSNSPSLSGIGVLTFALLPFSRDLCSPSPVSFKSHRLLPLHLLRGGTFGSGLGTWLRSLRFVLLTSPNGGIENRLTTLDLDGA